MNDLRIISFLPAATEMACALGLVDQLVGVSHECDYPPAARGKPVAVRCALPVESMSAREIDIAVSECIHGGGSLYEVDERLLERLAPTHILTQALCQVCAPSGHEITRALNALASKPQILWFTPHCLEDIFDNLRELGRVTGRLNEAEEWIASAHARLKKTSDLVRHEPRPRVFCLEWTDPCYCSGHWVPEMVEMAGGMDALGHKGTDSVRLAWADIAAWSPEVLIVSPCGFGTNKAVELTNQLLQQPGWSELPAVRHKRVFAVNANAYFARPGPRVVEGVELLAHLIHPKLCRWNEASDAFLPVQLSNSQTSGKSALELVGEAN
jgi:iron complex transport system substrate-binding protein